MSTPRTKLTAEALKNELWDSLLKLKAKRLRPDISNAVANQARAIMRVVRTEIILARVLGEQPERSILPTNEREGKNNSDS